MAWQELTPHRHHLACSLRSGQHCMLSGNNGCRSWNKVRGIMTALHLAVGMAEAAMI